MTNQRKTKQTSSHVPKRMFTIPDNSWTTAGQAKNVSSSPSLVKVYEEAVIKSEARTAVVQLKSEA